jgi:hypothetical protein
MPITVTAPRGVLTEAGEREILPRLTEALAEASGLKGNASFTAMIGGTVHLLDAEHIYGGGTHRPLLLVELKLPNIGLASVELRADFIASATAICEELSVPGHRLEDVWINILNAEDGAWGIAGRALTNQDLLDVVSAG